MHQKGIGWKRQMSASPAAGFSTFKCILGRFIGCNGVLGWCPVIVCIIFPGWRVGTEAWPLGFGGGQGGF